MMSLSGCEAKARSNSYSVGDRWTSDPATRTIRCATSISSSPFLKMGSAPASGAAVCRSATRMRASSSSTPNGFVR